MLFYHSDQPNAQVLREIGQQRITFIALRVIEAGEEITFLYACHPWFAVQS
jgi:SET domain-containing protein